MRSGAGDRGARVTANKKGGRGGEREGCPGRGGRERPRPGPEAPENAGRARARGMTLVDPWGALLERLLEVPEEETGADEKAPKRK